MQLIEILSKVPWSSPFGWIEKLQESEMSKILVKSWL